MTPRLRWTVNIVLVLVVLAVLIPWGSIPNPVDPVKPDPPTKAVKSITLVYEKDSSPPEPAVKLALRRVTAETEIEAGETDDDATTPRFQEPIRLATTVPSLVVIYSDGTHELIDPTAEAVLKAAGLDP